MNEAQSPASGFEKLASAGRNLWLAGLGVVAEVEEGGRGLFDRLVERGRPMEAKQRETLEKVGGKTNETVRGLGKLMQDTMEYETKGVLKKLGLLTRDDVRILAARLESLSHKIDEMSARQEIAAAPLIVTPDMAPDVTSNNQPATGTAPKERRPRQRQTVRG